MEIKKTTKYDGKLKNCSVQEGELVDENGAIIDIVALLGQAYGDKFFDISTTTKTEEIILLEETDEEEEY